jgi:hypothetical protein
MEQILQTVYSFSQFCSMEVADLQKHWEQITDQQPYTVRGTAQWLNYSVILEHHIFMLCCDKLKCALR